jgi:hypothetical protein
MMTRFTSYAWLLSLLAGCGGPPPVPPEGFTVAVDFQSIDVAIVESIRIRFNPPDTTQFAAVEDSTFEDGAISLHQDPDSSLVFDITGEHVRANMTPSPDGALMFYELQVWSDDPVMQSDGPLLLGSASRSSMVIGQGTGRVPTWPPPVEEDDVCSGTECRARLPIACTPSAANMGLCFR